MGHDLDSHGRGNSRGSGNNGAHPSRPLAKLVEWSGPSVHLAKPAEVAAIEMRHAHTEREPVPIAQEPPYRKRKQVAPEVKYVFQKNTAKPISPDVCGVYKHTTRAHTTDQSFPYELTSLSHMDLQGFPYGLTISSLPLRVYTFFLMDLQGFPYGLTSLSL